MQLVSPMAFPPISFVRNAKDMPALTKEARQNWPSAALSTELIQHSVQQCSLPDPDH